MTPFDRIAYCLDLTTTDGVRTWVYVSMDAFTYDIGKIGVPIYQRGAEYQQKVANMNVYASEGANVTTGTGIETGNIEFWPQNGNPASGMPAAALHHEGYSGWVISQLYNNVPNWLNNIDDPDIVLLHIGTNDSGAGDFANRIDQLDNLIDLIAAKRPYAHIIATTLLTRTLWPFGYSRRQTDRRWPPCRGCQRQSRRSL